MKDCPFKKNLTAGDGTRCEETGYFCTWQYEKNCKVKEKYMHQTNADRIRAMTDEELAEFLSNFAYDSEPGYKEVYDWLQEEVEE